MLILNLKERNMPSKSITISARIAHEDAEFLSQLNIDGAATPSDKLRALITEARKRKEQPRDYGGCLMMIQELLAPVLTQVRQAELAEKVHSELLTRTFEWLPEMVAYLLAGAPQAEAEWTADILVEYEYGLADRLFRLISSLLQLGVTPQCPCYSADAVARRIAPVLDLAEVISKQNRS
jgi:hypothetical protein